MTTELTLKVKEISLRNNIVAHNFKRGYLNNTPHIEILEKVVFDLVEASDKKSDLLMKYVSKFGALKDS